MSRDFLLRVNATRREYPRDATVPQLFAVAAARDGDRIAVVDGADACSYRALDERSARLARAIRARGVRTGDRVGLRIARGLPWVVGMLAVLRAGAVYVPIEPRHPARRAQGLLADCGARLLLVGGDGDRLEGIECLDAAAAPGAEAPLADDAGALDPAYVMYTSGTTGEPKGVVVAHRSVVRLVVGADYVDFSPDMRLLQTGAAAFDATTFEVWGTLLHGGRLVIGHDDVLVDAQRLRAALADHAITTMWLTSPLFSRLARSDATLFRPLRDLVVGGDVVAGEHVAAVLRACPGLRIVNGYGPTENTTFSTTHAITAADTGAPLPIGRPIANSTAYVLDERGQPVAPGEAGELHVGGDGVALGYLGRPELTAAAFLPDPFLPGRMYRTGDRARWRPDGTLEFLGRVDGQTKIRGHRVEPGEVEHAIRRRAGVADAAVVARERSGDGPGARHLVGYVIPAGPMDLRALRRSLSEELPEHLVPAHLVAVDAFPLNANGKLDRARLPDPAELPGPARHPVAPRDGLERELVELCRDVLGDGTVGPLDDLYDLGVDSLTAGTLAERIGAAHAGGVRASDVLRAGTVAELARLIRGQREPAAPAPAPDDPAAGASRRATARHPVSPQQRRLFVEQGKDERSVRYNVPLVVELGPEVDAERLRAAFARLSERHEILRTDFAHEGELVQRVRAAGRVRLEQRAGAPVLDQLVRPFDLGAAPLMRATLHRDGDRRWLFVDLHHIVTDGRSLAIMFGELDRLYAGESLPAPAHQYRDYAAWLGTAAGAALRERQGPYWRRLLAPPLPVADLPTDRPRPAARSARGAVVPVDAGPRRSASLRALAGRHGVTVFSALAAAYACVLAAVTGAGDVTFGVPVSGRTRPGLDAAVGMFVNTVCLRVRPGRDMRFADLLEEVARTTQDALAHQDHPFDELVEDLGARRGPGRTPLFDTMLAVHAAPLLDVRFLGRRVRLEPRFTGEAMFDLNLQLYDAADGIRGEWQYATDLFDAPTVRTFRSAFLRIVDRVIEDPTQTVAELADGVAARPRRAVALPALEFDL